MLLRSYGAGHFEACEDAVQDAIVQGLRSWPTNPPRDPRAWLITSARHRLVDVVRSETARRAREVRSAALELPNGAAGVADDSLDLLLLCCHPALTPPAQIALTLRAVAGLTTAQIAQALLLPEPTVTQRISRAKAAIRAAGGTFPSVDHSESRIETALGVLYVMYTAGHTTAIGNALYDIDVTREAIRLTRLLHSGLPAHAEATGLLALMLLTDARRDARIDEHGAFVALDQQDRSKWNRTQIEEGTELLQRARPGTRAGPYLLQAAIAAVHDEAPDTERTDWRQIIILYKVLEHRTPSPVITLNRAVAEAMLHGPDAGLRLVKRIQDHPALAHSHHLLAVRAHLLERAGQHEQARRDYLAAARLTLNSTEQRHLRRRANEI